MTRSGMKVGAGLLLAMCVAAACAPTLQQTRPQGLRTSAAPIAQLWSDPKDLGQRNLVWGPGREASAPSTRAPYTVLKKDDSGYSPGYDVAGPDGRKWSIKLGKEAQPEVVLSRILWALGYHQPQTYFVKGWQLTGDWKNEGEPARFRLQSDHENDGEWPWVDNPFAGSTPMHGLVAINLLLGNWDLKTSNNRIYLPKDATAEAKRRYVVQDLGASLGKWGIFKWRLGQWPPLKWRVFPIMSGSRNDIDDFEATSLISEVRDGEVRLNYRGRHGEIFSRLSIADVVWACELMNQLRDSQLDDAFKAADYPTDVRQRYVRKIRERIREGLALRPAASARAGARP
jgi:hypothetical protein